MDWLEQTGDRFDWRKGSVEQDLSETDSLPSPPLA